MNIWHLASCRPLVIQAVFKTFKNFSKSQCFAQSNIDKIVHWLFKYLQATKVKLILRVKYLK